MPGVAVTADVDRSVIGTAHVDRTTPGTPDLSCAIAGTADGGRRSVANRWPAVVGGLLAILLTGGCASTAGSSVPAAAAEPTVTASQREATTAPRTTSTTSEPTTPPLAPLAGTPDSQTYPFQPTSLALPSGAVADVDPAGVDDASALQVPADLARVGWWTGGALVGEPFGSVVLAGHLDSEAQGVGVLAELLELRLDDRVVVGDGTRSQAYRVVSVDGVPKARLGPGFEAFRQDVDHRLVLITCGGAFDRATHSYADNVVVVAVPTA